MKNVRHRLCTVLANRTNHTIPSGFTLIELLVVVFLITTLATIAISSYINSTDTFSFLSEYKNVMSSLRTARSYAITNKATNDEVPERYGIQVRTNRIAAFSDVGDDDFAFDDPNPPPVIFPILIGPFIGGIGGIGGVPGLVSVGVDDAVIKRYNFTDYRVEVLDSTAAHNPITMPITIFYEIGSGELTIFDGGTPPAIIDKNAEKYIALRFYEIPETANSLEKYVVIFQVSGLPEEFNDLDDL